MFEVVVQSAALRQLRRFRRVDVVTILDAMETHLRHQPERPTRNRIKRLRGRQDATYRLRVGDHRIFYDINEATVTVVAALHKQETAAF